MTRYDMERLIQAGERLMSLGPDAIGRYLRAVRKLPALVKLTDEWLEPHAGRDFLKMIPKPGTLREMPVAERHALTWGLLVQAMSDSDPPSFIRAMCLEVALTTTCRTLEWRQAENFQATVEALIRPTVEALEDHILQQSEPPMPEMDASLLTGSVDARPVRRLRRRLDDAVGRDMLLAQIRLPALIDFIDAEPAFANLRMALDDSARRQTESGNVARYLGPTPMYLSTLDEIDAAGVSWAVLRDVARKGIDSPWGLKGVWHIETKAWPAHRRKPIATELVELVRPVAEFIDAKIHESKPEQRAMPAAPTTIALQEPIAAVVVQSGSPDARPVTQAELSALLNSFTEAECEGPSLLVNEIEPRIARLDLGAEKTDRAKVAIRVLRALLDIGRAATSRQISEKLGVAKQTAHEYAQRLSSAVNRGRGHSNFVKSVGPGEDRRYSWSPDPNARFLLVFQDRGSGAR